MLYVLSPRLRSRATSYYLGPIPADVQTNPQAASQLIEARATPQRESHVEPHPQCFIAALLQMKHLQFSAVFLSKGAPANNIHGIFKVAAIVA